MAICMPIPVVLSYSQLRITSLNVRENVILPVYFFINGFRFHMGTFTLFINQSHSSPTAFPANSPFTTLMSVR
jgi:hypothetical protein